MRLRPLFRGWWIVAGCQVVAIVAWSLGLFGGGVYLHALNEGTGLSIGLISSAMTSCYLLAALAQVAVGGAIDRFGPAPVLSFGALALAAALAGIGQAGSLWQIYAAFLALGLGWACLSTTALSTTLAPWFDRYHGRAVSTAMLGASVGGMIGAPALLFGIARFGLSATTLAAALLTLLLILPIASLLLRLRPHELGLTPDGMPPRADSPGAGLQLRWTRVAALRTPALVTVMIAFGLGLLVQIGFLTHQVPLLLPSLGALGTSVTVTASAIAAFGGRLVLARYSDRVDVRLSTVIVLALAATSLAAMAVFPGRASLVTLNIVYGFTTGILTTLAPIIVRREFGAISFGAVYGAAASGVQLVSALGPSFFGVLYDRFDGYGPALLIAAVLDVAAGASILFGARRLAVAPMNR